MQANISCHSIGDSELTRRWRTVLVNDHCVGSLFAFSLFFFLSFSRHGAAFGVGIVRWLFSSSLFLFLSSTGIVLENRSFSERCGIQPRSGY